MAEVVGRDVFASDIILMNGLDDRAVDESVLAEAQELMADADYAFSPPVAAHCLSRARCSRSPMSAFVREYGA